MKKRIPKAIKWLPNFIMKLLGKRHANQSKELCDAHLNAWMNKGAVVYDREVKSATSITNEAETRVENDLHQIMRMLSDVELSTNEDIQMRRKTQVNALASRIWANMDMIGATDRILETRLREVMDMLNYKLDFYKAGAIVALNHSDKGTNASELFPSVNLMETHEGYVSYRKKHVDLEKRIADVLGSESNRQLNNDVA